MNCTLTPDQQKQLFKKVYSDLKTNEAPLDFKKYAEEVYDLVNNKLKDSAMALSYVSLLPQNIRLNIGVNKSLSQKFAKNFEEITQLENSFSNLDNVSTYVKDLKRINVGGIVDLEKNIQDNSLRPDNKPDKVEGVEKVVENPIEPITGLSDLTFENISPGEEILSPDKKLYANIKRQLIKNAKQDGSSYIEGFGLVKLQVVSTQLLEDKDLYPDTQRQIQNGDDATKAKIKKSNETGAVLIVTDSEGKILYFDENGNKVDRAAGKPAYFLFRNPQPNKEGKFILSDMDKQAVMQMAKALNLSHEDATKAYLNRIGIYKNIRKFINEAPLQNRLDVNITGGFTGIPSKADSALKTPLAGLNLGNVSFFPYQGVEAKGQNLQSYYFDIPNLPVPVQIKRPDVSKEMAEKLASLMFDGIHIEQRGAKYPLAPQEKIRLFEQFFYTSPITISFKVDGDKIVMRKFGEVVTATTPQEYKDILIDYLTRLQPSKELKKEQVGTRKIVTDIAEAKNNYVYKVEDNGKTRYFLVQPSQLEISRTAMKNNAYEDFTLENVEGALIYKSEQKPYTDFIKNNFVINYPLDASGNIQTVNAVLNFDLPVDSVSKIKNKKAIDKKIEHVVKTSVPPAINQTDLSQGEPVKKLSAKDFLAQQRKKNPDVFNKLIDQKGLQATEDQIADAMTWYNAHPMSKAFPFESAFNVVNLNDPNSIATWTANGITLLKGSDFSDLYHEAWHGFSQGFLSKNDKGSLYNELRKKSGSFIDYTGTRVTFAKATELQAEEFLAEDFREFMLSGGKKVMKDFPVRKNIFTKILDFLRSLFGGTTYNQTLIDKQVNNTVKTLYDKLRLGNLTDYSFSVENRNFNTLNKGISALNKIDVPSLSFEDSKLILDTINSLFSEYADANNSYTEEFDEAKESPKQTYKYTTQLFETPEGLMATYEYVKFRLASIHDELKAQQLEKPSPDIQNKIDLLKWTVRNFGNTEDIFRNKVEVGVIGYHLTNSDYVPTSIKEDLQDDTDLEGRETEGKQYYDRGGNETSIFDLANKEIINILKGLPKYNSKGIVYSKLNLPELNPFNETFAHIAKTVQNLTTPQKMYEAMEKEIENYPTLKHLLQKLGPVEYEGQSTDEVNNWTRFWQTFNKYRIPLIQTTLNNVVITDREGRKVSSTYEIAIGNAVADFRRVGQRWENLFAQAQTNPFIKNNATGNYLDIDAIIKKYPNRSDVNGNEFDFLTDIGIALKDTRTIRGELNKSIRSGDIKLGGIYDNIKKLSEKGTLVKNISRYIKKDTDLGIEGEGGANGNYGKLEKLQYRFADEDADFMVINAAGDPQSEFSQNTTLTQLIKRINEVESYSELISSPEMGYLNKTELEPGKSYNSAIESSIWIKSLFNMSVPGGPKYPGAKIDIVNLSGLTKSVNGNNIGEGDISTDLDEYSKLIQDIHTQLMSGTPELTRHAGKKTSLSVFLNNYKTYAGKTTSNLYIDTDDFAIQSGDISKGVAQGIELITPYITSELKRINYAKYLMSDEANVKNYDFTALKNMTEFTKFSGVLSEGTQKKLLAIKGDVETYLKSSESLPLRNEIENDIIKYFGDLYKGIDKKLSEAEYLSPSLYKGIKSRLTANGNIQFANDAAVRTAIINSFIWNNWIHHVEENILLYGDVSLYKNEQDFFKRNAALNSTGDILRNDAAFKRHVNTNLGKPLAAKLGATPDVLTYNGILNTAVVSDIEIPSVYHAQYKEALDEAVIDKAYGKVNEADAAAFVTYDTYRIIRSALGKWGKEDEDLYQKELNGERIKNVEKFPAVVKMGYYGPLETNYLPLQALHKFALFPLIPSVVKGTNLENLHNKMMKEGIDYLTFKSGSKISTITKGGTADTLYSDTQKRVMSETPFTKNPIYADYLKDQVEASSKFKNKVTFFSQLRKLVDNGLMENGIPVDFKGGKETWDKLSVSEKLTVSPKFKKRHDFLNNLNKLQDYKRQQLLGELGWKLDKNGKPTGDIKPLLELITRELKRRDFPEHTWQFIQTIKDNQIKNSLDISQFAEDIEKVVVAVINKRLVNFKVNGEQLVQVTGTGFENVSFAYGEGRDFEKPTAEDLKKYGTNDLPTYHKNADGSTAAAKVKIALQGQFKNLLKLTEVQAKAKELKVDSRTALNTLLKDEEWLNAGDNRRMITMIGARIPTQGLNSMEFVEVYEFLPEQAGNIIIASSEITAKSGTDYDYDKLPMMMPNIRVKAGKVELALEYTKKQAKELYDTLVDFNVNKASLQGVTRKDLENFMNAEKFEKFETAMIKLWGENYLDNLVDVVKNDSGLSDFDTFFERLNGTAVIENNIIQAVKNILSDPDNFTSLIRPNSTEKVEPIAKDIMAPLVTDPSLLRTNSRGTAVFEPLKNLQIHQSNTTGKRTLGIGAIENTYNTIFNGIGMHLNPEFTKGNNKTPFRADILLPHNSIKVAEKNVISLAGLKDAVGENNTSDIISQLINGWVDVEKDDWVSYIQGNQEVAPTLLFLVQAGVPIKDAIYFVSQPLIRKYVTEQRLYKSKFADVLGKIADNPRATRIAARNSILGNVGYNFQIGDKLSDKNIYDATLNETKGITNFTQEQLLDNLKHYSASTNRGQQFKPGDLDRQTFLHYLELENMVGYLQQLKLATNVDTNTATTLFDMRAKVGEIEKNESGNLFPAAMVEAIKKDSAIGPYFMQEFASDIFSRLFPLRNNETVNQYISALGFNKDLARIFGEKEKMVKLFKNDLINYIFQNGVRKFTLEGLQNYKNNELTISPAETEFGAIVKGDKLFVDKEALQHQYNFSQYTTDEYGKGILAKLNQNTFTSFDEYSHFVLERETLRSMYNLSSLKNDFEFKGLIKKYMRKDDLRKEGQTDEEFTEMVDKKSYEEWLRNKALYNIMNPWIMFKSGQSVADKFARIIEEYPQVKDNYSLLKGIQYSEGQQGYRNLKLAGAKIDGSTAEIYNENLKNLKNESVVKVENTEDNKYISDFFSNFSTWMFMQSGLNNTPFSFNKIILQEDVTRLLDGPYKEFLKELSPEHLNKFNKLFLMQNANKAVRLRSKNYLEGGFDYTLPVEEEAAEEAEAPKSTPSQKIVISPEELTDLLSKCYK